ncbi:DIP1984 family protein [Corynebacterium freiburgense]|uniref:DIP1984 family protein n=1 Tax=Corynebacterium freiburgense TaxID=556548 RepID=UPI0004225556|nr:DIP1984 family protein [Corynebacterium freiburgense]WJZ03672.1 hypothetical protein CFREI_12075 [Corynebacterium freiburgense]
MKLSEALAARADAQRKFGQIKDRIQRVSLVQEGDTPNEDPATLIAEAEAILDSLETLIRRINATNAATKFDQNLTLTDAIAARDTAKRRSEMYREIANAANPTVRYSANEIRSTSTVKVSEMQAKADQAAQQYRELDLKIQQLNWVVELL